MDEFYHNRTYDIGTIHKIKALSTLVCNDAQILIKNQTKSIKFCHATQQHRRSKSFLLKTTLPDMTSIIYSFVCKIWRNPQQNKMIFNFFKGVCTILLILHLLKLLNHNHSQIPIHITQIGVLVAMLLIFHVGT